MGLLGKQQQQQQKCRAGASDPSKSPKALEGGTAGDLASPVSSGEATISTSRRKAFIPCSSPPPLILHAASPPLLPAFPQVRSYRLFG